MLRGDRVHTHTHLSVRPRNDLSSRAAFLQRDFVVSVMLSLLLFLLFVLDVVVVALSCCSLTVICRYLLPDVVVSVCSCCGGCWLLVGCCFDVATLIVM